MSLFFCFVPPGKHFILLHHSRHDTEQLPRFKMGHIVAQRKIPVDLHFIVRLRHKASGAALGLSCAVCFEQPAGVFAGCGAVCQAKILASLKIKNGISLTPLN